MSRADLTQRAGATEKAGMAVLILVEWGYLLRVGGGGGGGGGILADSADKTEWYWIDKGGNLEYENCGAFSQ